MARLRKKPASTIKAAAQGSKTSTPPTQAEAVPGRHLFVPGHPKEGGPPEVIAHAGGDVLSDESAQVVVTLDNGAFRWLWEVTEMMSLRHWNQYGGMGSMATPQAGRRALAAIRNAGHHQYRPDPQTMPKKHRPYPSPLYVHEPKIVNVKSTTARRRLKRKPAS